MTECLQKATTIKNTVSFLLLLWILTFNATAQKTNTHPPGYIFTNYTASDGLSSSEIISLATDKKGFLWTGTMAGLSRYDGYTFTNFTYSADDHLIGVVNAIINDTAGKLWIGASSGLYCYSQNRLARVSAVSNKQISVNGIVAEANGDLWLATDSGPVFINAAGIDTTGTKKLQLQDFVLPGWSEKYARLYGSRCEQIKKAPDGTIYFSQQYQLFRIISGQAELIYTSNERDVIEYFFPVSRSKVFYNTSVTGLHKMEDGKHTLYYFKDLYQPARKPRSEGYWYVGSLGLVCFHPDEEFISETIVFWEAGAQWLSSVIKENNILWLGSHSGLIKVKPSVFHLYSENEYNDVQESFSFCELQQGNFLIGVNHGSIYEFNGESIKGFLTGDHRPVKYAEIKAMYEDQRGWLWIGTGYQGIAVYRKGITTRFTSEANKLHDNSFYSFLQTRNGKLYAIGDQGMTEIIIDAKDNISFVPYVSPPMVTQHGKFYGGIEAPGGTVWIAGEEGIRFLQNDSLVHFSLFNKNIPVRDIRMANDRSVWIASSGEGVFSCRFDEKGKLQIVKHYTEKDGLNTLQFLDLLIDKEDNVWAGSIKGLTFIGRNGKYKNMLVNFTEADGFIKPAYYSMKLYQDKNGLVWTGTSLGIASFMPGELFLSALPPKIYITGIDFLKGNDRTANNNILSKENNGPPLSLPWFNNSLNFEYTAIDQAAPGGLHYYYRMEGLDTNWINAGLRRSVTYHNLAAGSYTFSVKAINEK
ncbi:MAG: two-component regulator propeller domain-containing protein, partial [Chitinophagaceae bacterium]